MKEYHYNEVYDNILASKLLSVSLKLRVTFFWGYMHGEIFLWTRAIAQNQILYKHSNTYIKSIIIYSQT